MRRSKHGRAGFTVVELMVALAVGGVAISALYAVGAASTRHFREQGRISTTQTSLRAAMNQLKRDFQRAGYLATPNVALAAERCMTVGAPLNDTAITAGRGRLAAISNLWKNVARPNELDPDNLNPWATVDEVILMGNYATSGEYSGVTLAPDRLSATIPTGTHSFRRDFTHWYGAGANAAGSCNQAALTNAFPPGRLVKLHALSDSNAFVQVSSATCGLTTATIAFSQQVGNACQPTGGWISPVNTIRYWVTGAPQVEASRIGDNRVAVLRRTEMNPSNKAQRLDIVEGGVSRPADDRTVLDYVVRFEVNFLLRGNDPNTVGFVPASVTDVRATPERVRGVIIELAARTAEHEPDMDATLFDNLRSPPFRVLDTRGAARTRALRAELLLPNIAQEDF